MDFILMFLYGFAMCFLGMILEKILHPKKTEKEIFLNAFNRIAKESYPNSYPQEPIFFESFKRELFWQNEGEENTVNVQGETCDDAIISFYFDENGKLLNFN